MGRINLSPQPPHRPPRPIPTTAPALRDYKGRIINDADRQWWSFKQPVRFPVPSVSEASWAKNPIDGFLLKSLADQGLACRRLRDHAAIDSSGLSLT